MRQSKGGAIMKNTGKFASAIILVAMLFGASLSIANAQHVVDDSENPEYLFAMSAMSGSFENDRLSLSGIPLVVYFSDRPYRLAGHTSLQNFGSLWNEGADAFSKDPPNAQLSIYYGHGEDAQAVLTISEPEISGNSISFSVRILEGDITETFEFATLFIDGVMFGCPCE